MHNLEDKPNIGNIMWSVQKCQWQNFAMHNSLTPTLKSLFHP
jgi:hypothetical protein